MGMSGMTSDQIANYAAGIKENPIEVNSKKRPMTVAEYRNKINPTTGYYDMWSIDSFISDKSISVKTKIETLCGKLFADSIQNENAWNAVFSKITKL